LVVMMTRAHYFVLLLTLGCSAQRLKQAPSVDCSLGNAYEFFGADGLANVATSRAIYDFEVGDTGWYQAGDCSGGHWDLDAAAPNADGGPPGACVVDTSIASPITGNVPPVTIDGGRCGSKRAALIESYGHGDWGSLYGTWDIGSLRPPANGTGSDGISFWARNPDRTGHAQGATNKTIWFSVGDYRQVVAENTTAAYPTPGNFRCVPAPPTTSAVGFTDSGQVIASTRVPAANECGNLFRAAVTTTNDWQLYLLPWSSLYQDTLPNRNPGGIDAADIRLLQISIPIGATVELWLDDIAFYRARTGDAGN
jgi:hypothetical protein